MVILKILVFSNSENYFIYFNTILYNTLKISFFITSFKSYFFFLLLLLLLLLLLFIYVSFSLVLYFSLSFQIITTSKPRTTTHNHHAQPTASKPNYHKLTNHTTSTITLPPNTTSQPSNPNQLKTTTQTTQHDRPTTPTT